MLFNTFISSSLLDNVCLTAALHKKACTAIPRDLWKLYKLLPLFVFFFNDKKSTLTVNCHFEGKFPFETLAAIGEFRTLIF